MSLLKEIQDAAVDSETDIVQVLRKCRVLASRLGHDQLKDWVQKELDGYDVADRLPDYRVKHCHSKGHFVGFAGAQLRNAPIPTQNIPEEFRDAVTTARFRESISALQDLIRMGDKDSYGSPWPPEAIQAFGDQFYQDMRLLEAHQVIPRSAMVSVIETVRNKVLNFALEIEAANPSAGEAAPGSEPLPQKIVNQIFNNYISGNVGNIASGSSNFGQSAEINISKGDDEALGRTLKSMGVARAEIDELRVAITSDPPLAANRPFGPRVSTWLGGILAKSARGH